MEKDYTAALIIVLVGIFTLYFFLMPTVALSTETRQEEEAYTINVPTEEQYMENVCNNVNLKGSSTFKESDSYCIKTTTECANTEQYCCAYKQECATYEQYCTHYGLKNGACKKWNWLGTVCAEYYQVQGDCETYGTRCSSNKDVCSKQCSRCAGYEYPCTQYYQYCIFLIKNLDDTRGYFTITSNIFDANDNILKEETKGVWVDAADQEEISFDYYSNTEVSFSCSGVISEYPTKNKCENVVKTRTVDKPTVMTRLIPKEYVVKRSCTLAQRVFKKCK